MEAYSLTLDQCFQFIAFSLPLDYERVGMVLLRADNLVIHIGWLVTDSSTYPGRYCNQLLNEGNRML